MVRISSRFIRGTTLIETLVVLGLFVGLAVLLRPVMVQIVAPLGQDDQAQGFFAFNDALQAYLKPGATLTVVPSAEGRKALRIDQGEPLKISVVEMYQSKQARFSPDQLRVRVAGAGHMPILMGGAGVTWEARGDYVGYTLQMHDGQQFAGVLVVPDET